MKSRVSCHSFVSHSTGLMAVLCVTTMVGCATSKTTHTARTASEQLLISSAIDRAFSNVRFDDFAGQKVFINDAYLDTVDKGYLMGALRHRVLGGGGLLVAAADAADVVMEPRSGGVGTDAQESFIGVPAIGLPGLPIEIPEIKLVSRQTQIGTAKIGLVCYDAKTGQAVGSGGDSTALTHHSDTYLMGVGPFRSGAVVQQREHAVGFNGVGGSLLGPGTAIARRGPVQLVTPNATPADLPGLQNLGPGGATATEQIATMPTDSQTR